MKIEIKILIKKIEDRLGKNSAQAWWLLEKLTSKTKTELLLNNFIEIDQKDLDLLDSWLTLITESAKPIQYILGFVQFCDLNIFVEEPILIPRPETEEWVTFLIEQFKKVKNEKIKILDMCTGSGCIALALAHFFKNSEILGADINPKAIELSEKNKTFNKIFNAKFILSDFYSSLSPNNFDLIVSNPPYIDPKDFFNLDENVKNWEDKNALISPNEGFAAIKHIIKNAKKYLNPNSVLKKYELPQIFIEFGKGQETKVSEILKDAGFSDIKIYKDFSGIYRFATAKL